MATLEEERAAHEETKARLADVMGDGGSFRNLQIKLDEALQKNADDAAAHALEVDGLKAAHKADRESLADTYEKVIQQLREQHQAELDELRASLTESHAADIAKLKAEVLLPAIRDLHARQAADLAAQQAAQLANL